MSLLHALYGLNSNHLQCPPTSISAPEVERKLQVSMKSPASDKLSKVATPKCISLTFAVIEPRQKWQVKYATYALNAAAAIRNEANCNLPEKSENDHHVYIDAFV